MWFLAKFRNKNVNVLAKNNGHQNFTESLISKFKRKPFYLEQGSLLLLFDGFGSTSVIWPPHSAYFSFHLLWILVFLLHLPFFILQQLSILLPCDSLLLALPRFFFACSHTCGVHQRIFSKRHFPTHALWSCATHTCTCSDCPLIFPIHQLVSHHLLGCSQVHRGRRNSNKLFSNGAAGPRFLFKYWWPQKEDWVECDGKICPFQSINAIAWMQIISKYTLRLDQTVWSRQYSSAV